MAPRTSRPEHHTRPQMRASRPPVSVPGNLMDKAREAVQAPVESLRGALQATERPGRTGATCCSDLAGRHEDPVRSAPWSGPEVSHGKTLASSAGSMDHSPASVLPPDSFPLFKALWMVERLTPLRRLSQGESHTVPHRAIGHDHDRPLRQVSQLLILVHSRLL